VALRRQKVKIPGKDKGTSYSMSSWNMISVPLLVHLQLFTGTRPWWKLKI